MTTPAHSISAEMNDEQFRRHALAILERELGANGLARFVRVYGRAYRDYTRDRHQWQKGLTVAGIAEQIKSRREN